MNINIKPRHIPVKNIPEISAIYFALLQCDYDFYESEKPIALSDKIKDFTKPKHNYTFFGDVRQNT